MNRNLAWTPCDCTSGQDCTNFVRSYVPHNPSTKPDIDCTDQSSSKGDISASKDALAAKALFHIRTLSPQDQQFDDICLELGKPLRVEKVLEIQNPLIYSQYQARKAATEILNDGDANEVTSFHVSKGSLFSICQTNLDYRNAQRGFFGKGLYTSPDPLKANDYSNEKGNPSALRVMLRCKVLLGRVKEFEMGRFDRDLISEPEGFDSVKGFIRRGSEYVVYSSDRIYVTHLIFYKVNDTALELSAPLNLPPNVSGHIVYITASLSEFFGKLQQRAGPATSPEYVAVRKLIGTLLKKQIDVDSFLAQISKILKAAPPADLAVRMKTELEKCKLPPPPPSSSTPSEDLSRDHPPQPCLDSQSSNDSAICFSDEGIRKKTCEDITIEAPLKQLLHSPGTLVK